MLIDILIVTRLINFYTNNSILHDYQLVKTMGFIICVPLAFFNYYIFITRRYWKPYEKMFKKLGRNKKILAHVGVLLFMVFFIWFCFLTK
jgi:Sec-independent protein secretion pathway component TatC